MPPAPASPVLLAGAFAVVWFVWGSSYLANKLMVLELPPLLAAGVRFAVAGVLLGAIALARGAAVPRARLEWRHFAVMGLLTVLVSNGINVVALRYVASNQAALINASSAFWIALLGTFGARGQALGPRAALGLALGFAGVALLMWPHGGYSAQSLGWQLAIVGGCFGWALGTLYYRSIQSATDPLLFTALQMLVGGLATMALGLALGDGAEWRFSWRGHLSLAYLVVFSSCLAYTAYAYLMTHTTPARLGTYAYVNPAVAAVLGWLLLDERLAGVQLVGTAVILAGVVLVTLPARSPTTRVLAERNPNPPEQPG